MVSTDRGDLDAELFFSLVGQGFQFRVPATAVGYGQLATWIYRVLLLPALILTCYAQL